MSEEIKVFISSQMRLKEERNLAKAIIEQELGLKPILYEYEPPESQAREWWERSIGDSWFFVFILKNFLSFPVYDEFKIADSRGIHILAFVKDINFIEKQLNPDTLKSIPKSEQTKLYGSKITQEDIKWFHQKFNDPKGVKWAEFKDCKYFRKMLKKGIQEKLGERFPGIKEDEIYDSEEIDRINKIFVPPKNFEDAMQKLNDNRLLIILGPGSIGKTTMGLKLLRNIMNAESNAQREIITPEATVKRLRRLKDRKNSLIFFEAPFVGRDNELKDPDFAKFTEVFDLCKKNWVVITSREQPFKNAQIERRDINRYTFLLDSTAYDEDMFKQILKRHLDYYLEKGEITKDVNDYVNMNNNSEWISKNLTFPHNIYSLVKYNLKDVKNQSALAEAIDRSKDTVEASKIYFSKCIGKQRYFVIFVALFPNIFNEENSKPYLEGFFSLYPPLPIQLNIRQLREEVRYVRPWGKLGFEHEDYLDGAFEAIRDETFTEDINRLIEFLENISKDPNPDIRQAACFALRELVRVNPKVALPIVLKLLSSENRQVVESAFVPLRCLFQKEDFIDPHFDELILCLEKWINMKEINKAEKSNPNYKHIVYRKAIRDHLIGFYIGSGDIKGFINFRSRYYDPLNLRGNATLKLKNIWESDPNKAWNFFASWYERNPYDVVRDIQMLISTKWRTNMSIPFLRFVVDMLGRMPPEKAIEVIVKWSKAEAKGEESRRNYIMIISSSLSKISEKSPNRVFTLLKEWKIKGNEIQKNVANTRHFSDAHQLK